MRAVNRCMDLRGIYLSQGGGATINNILFKRPVFIAHRLANL